ncbi:MAG: DUF5320 domain-containing protein [Candidatus Nanoarchaeia archaeon]|jgi:hypothetical protein
MPNRDRTGPRGLGQLTGRGMGPCGCGMARGRRFARNRVLSAKDEKKLLEEDLEDLNQEKEEIEKRLKEL